MRAKKTEHRVKNIVSDEAFDLRELVIDWRDAISADINNDLTHNILPRIHRLTGMLLIAESKYCDLYKGELQGGYRTCRDGFMRYGVLDES